MPTVLVVDDSAVDRRLAGGLLEQIPGYEICYAENGSRAIEQIEKQPPDVILTDMQMPDMDGLELVTTVSLHYPKVPIILMTAHGSEELAGKALRSGAASYVPKADLAEKLCATVDEVCAIANADRTYERLIDCSVTSEFTFNLDNDAELIEPLADLTQRMIASMGVCGTTKRIQVGMAIEQALRNAIFRGNLEIQGEVGGQYERRRHEPPYCDRKTFVRIVITREEATITVADNGPGFDASRVQSRQLGDSAGRGLVLMTTFMDEVRFNAAGNEVTMIKRRDADE